MNHSRTHWKAIEKQSNYITKSQNYQISYNTLADAVAALSKYFGLTAVEGEEKADLGASVHQMMLGGEVKGRGEVLALAKVKMDQKYGCVLNLQVKAVDEEVCQMVMESLS